MEAEPIHRSESGRDALQERLLAELPAVRRMLSHLLGGRGASDLDDLMQEVVAKAWNSRDLYDPARPLGPWLRTLAFRLFLDHRQRAQKLPQPLPRPTEWPGSSSDGATRTESSEQVAYLLHRLEGAERAVMHHFYLEQCSVAEVAELLGIAEGTVKSHLHRARRRLARQIVDRGGSA